MGGSPPLTLNEVHRVARVLSPDPGRDGNDRERDDQMLRFGATPRRLSWWVSFGLKDRELECGSGRIKRGRLMGLVARLGRSASKR
jgi:hypothetical protein